MVKVNVVDEYDRVFIVPNDGTLGVYWTRDSDGSWWRSKLDGSGYLETSVGEKLAREFDAVMGYGPTGIKGNKEWWGHHFRVLSDYISIIKQKKSLWVEWMKELYELSIDVLNRGTNGPKEEV